MSGALFAAVGSADHIRAKFLLNRGVRINIRDSDGENILVRALHIDHDRRRHKMFKWLLSRGADIMAVSHTSGRDMLIWAAHLNRPEQVALILRETGGEVDFRRKDHRGYTALHYGTINDSGEILERLCTFMRKFELSVDVTDDSGLTPYLLARRLGHSGCAHILVDIGGACPYKGDEKTGQSQHFWETLGTIERQRKHDAEKGRVVGLYKRMGRLPQLRKAGFDTDHIKLVTSDQERKVIQEGRMLQRHGTLAPLNLHKFDPNEPVIASKINTDRSGQIPQSVLMNIHQELEKDRFFEPKPKRYDVTSTDQLEMMNSSPRMMNSILDMLSVQGTHSYKPPAIKPKSRGSVIGIASAAAFGLKLKRKLANSRAHRKAQKDIPGSAMNKDPLPIIVQN